jgi:hypothetical protein
MFPPSREANASPGCAGPGEPDGHGRGRGAQREYRRVQGRAMPIGFRGVLPGYYTSAAAPVINVTKV